MTERKTMREIRLEERTRGFNDCGVEHVADMIQAIIDNHTGEYKGNESD